MNHRLKKITATLVITALLTAPSISLPGDLNTEMQSMFNSLGTLGNVSSPGAFRGQAMNLYTGGSLFMREPSKNYALVRAQLPSLKAGCGGIDLFGGSFSFINKAQFVALLQNIGANAVGYAFKLALQSISPDIDKLLTELQDQINKINTMNINSCEAAIARQRRRWPIRQFDHERLRKHLAVPRQRHRPLGCPLQLRDQRGCDGQDGSELGGPEHPQCNLHQR